MTTAVLPPLDLSRLHAAYRDGLSPQAVVRGIFERLRVLADPGIFLHLMSVEDVLAAAAALGPFDPVAQPLWGVPFAVKDNIDVAGLPTTCACPDFAYVPSEHSPAVARLLAAGGLLVGKTNLDQFATGLVGVRTPGAAPRNALSAAHVPGGSSSGSAVAVAQGLVSLALGTDTAGSGRVPAAFNNIVGLKPTIGLVPTRGVVPACATLDVVSVFAQTVPDAWAAFQVIAGPDAADPASRTLPGGPPMPARPRLGVPDQGSRRFFGDTAAEAAFDVHLGIAAALGAELVPVDMTPFFEIAALLYQGPWVAERYAALRQVVEQRPQIMLPVTRGIVEGARAFSAADAFDGRYRLAELRRQGMAAMAGLDALVVPSAPTFPTVADLAADPLGPNARLGTYTNFVNLLDLSALAVPGPFRSDGLPAGITLVGPAGHDATLADFAARFHAAAGVALGATGTALPAEAGEWRTPAPAGEIEIVVVGAHLSGLALNHELTTRGGRLLRTCTTTPDYRFYALGGTPARPGMLRVPDGTGAAIAGEVWSLPPAGFGAFVAGIPAPLGIGTLRLADGTRPKGFLVEAEAVQGAEEITALGGWRAWLASR
ncbi:allophanate hydrolase [Zavarzinia sp. CC-PAN008]|uniref:allophanate hydrolase n=1 Tax=Zavarzinia sp. CC-PAN008 TaxID=3243332 RepID=UPI003F74ACEA